MRRIVWASFSSPKIEVRTKHISMQGHSQHDLKSVASIQLSFSSTAKEIEYDNNAYYGHTRRTNI
jgi:hypothetical protein